MPNMQGVSFTTPTDYAAEQQSIDRRRKLAEMLQGQAMQQEPNQTAGGWTVPQHPLQGVAKLAQAYVAAMGNKKADERQQALGQQVQQRRGADMSALVNAIGGRQASPGGPVEDAAGNVTQADPMAAQTPQQSLMHALPMMQDPQLQQAGLQALAQYAPKRPEPFTLKPGEHRFNESGMPVAQGAPEATPKPFALAPGHTQYDPQGKPVVTAPMQERPQDLTPVTTTTVMHNGVPTVVNARTYRPGSDAGIIGPANKPVATQLPGHALTEQQGHLDAMGIGGNINSDLGAVLQQLNPSTGPNGEQKPPELQLGPVNNAIGQVRNYVGMSNAQSQNLGTFKSTLEKLRNDSLRLNKGVQTEGDAVRAWNEILSNINDQEFVKKRLGEVQEINKRGVRQHQMQIDALRRNYGLDPMESQMANQPPAINPASAPQRRSTDKPKTVKWGDLP